MFTRIQRRLATVLIAGLTTAVLAGHANAMTVEPIVVDLKATGHGTSHVVSVQNNGTYALPVELSVQELTLGTDGVHPSGTDPGDLVAFPPQALIQPGQTQSFRVQYVGEPELTGSRHYYVTVAQVPVLMPHEPQTGVQILYKFQVLVNVGPAAAKPELQVVSATIGLNAAHQPIPVITVTNDSATYGYLAQGRLRLSVKDETGHEILHETLSPGQIEQAIGMGLIASRQRREVALPTVLSSERGTVDAQFLPAR